MFSGPNGKWIKFNLPFAVPGAWKSADGSYVGIFNSYLADRRKKTKTPPCISLVTESGENLEAGYIEGSGPFRVKLAMEDDSVILLAEAATGVSLAEPKDLPPGRIKAEHWQVKAE